MKRLLNPLTPDFRVSFADGGSFTSDDGTWDDVPREREITSIAHGATVLDVGDAFSFAWEAVALAPFGRSEQEASSEGTVVAVHLIATTGDQGCLLRIDRSGHVGVWRGTAVDLWKRIPEDRWRGHLRALAIKEPVEA